MDLTQFASTIDERGWSTTSPILADAEVVALRASVAPLLIDGRGGTRHLLAHAGVQALATSRAVRSLAAAVPRDGASTCRGSARGRRRRQSC
jgi:hypothetical protein